MRAFGLTPEQILARTPSAELDAPPLVFSVIYGAISVGLVSVTAYTVYAYRLIEGTVGMYSAIAAIYLGLTGLVLGRLVAGRGVFGRFALLFAVAFLLYAIVWCAFWFGFRGRHHADLWGSAVGLALMAGLLRRGFGSTVGLLPLWAGLFAFHTLGFYLGDTLHSLVRGTTGKLLWGAGHGVGFGAGLGYVLHACQGALRPARPRS